MNCLRIYLVHCRVQCCCCWKLVQSSKILRGNYSWLIDNSFSDRILPTSGHYICGNSKQKKTTASLLTFTIMKLECCKYGSHVHVKAVLTFRRSFNLSIQLISSGMPEPTLSMNRGFCTCTLSIATNLCQRYLLRPLAHPIPGFDACYPNFFSHRSQHEILVTLDVGLIVMAFPDSWTSTVQIEPKRN